MFSSANYSLQHVYSDETDVECVALNGVHLLCF